MEIMKMKERNLFLFGGRAKILYFMTLVALLAAVAVGYLLMPTGGVSAQSGERDVQDLIVLEPFVGSETATTTIDNDALEFGEVKVCKIAGLGVPLNQMYTFRARGRGPVDAAGTVGDVDITIQVAAGAPNAQGGGGNCNFVPGFGAGLNNAERQTFVIGTTVRIDELAPNFTQGGQALVSNITSTSGGTASLSGKFAEVPAAVPLIEVTFTNFIFRPSILKICKIAGNGVAVGTPFTFDVTLANPVSGGIFPPFTISVTVNAGPAGPQGGNCEIVGTSGAGGSLLGGAFAQGSTVRIIERQASGTFVSNISSPTSDLPPFVGGRSTTLSGANGIVEGVTQVSFTNSPLCSCGLSDREPDCSCRPPTPFDFDSDGKADLSVFRPSNGTWYINQSSAGFTSTAFGQNGDRIVPANYDGDFKTDIAVYRGGNWYLNRSTAGFIGVNFGTAEDIPQPADFNNDGKADLAVFRPSNGTWYVMNLETGEFTATKFGQTGDQPVAADYDGDGTADYAVFRSGIWYILRSKLGFFGVGFGQAGDLPVPADYDGDGKVDIAVYRPSNGVWYIQRSTSGYAATAFGISTDMPTPADYDGDGRADIAVFRPLDGVWYLNRSISGFTAIQFGQNGDRPAPNAFVLQ